ncbi:hypothetical protein [Gordonia oryzae]
MDSPGAVWRCVVGDVSWSARLLAGYDDQQRPTTRVRAATDDSLRWARRPTMPRRCTVMTRLHQPVAPSSGMDGHPGYRRYRWRRWRADVIGGPAVERVMLGPGGYRDHHRIHRQ